MLHRARPLPRRAQRGVTMFGLLSWAIVIGFVAYVGVRVLPTVNEYLTIQRAVNVSPTIRKCRWSSRSSC